MSDMQIKTVLVPVDFSEPSDKALEFAIRMTKKIKANLVLVHVLELTSFTSPMEMMSMGWVSKDMISSLNESLKKRCQDITEEFGIKSDFACYSGNVYDNILRAAYLFESDLIVMGTHGTSGLGEWIFGSNAFNVVHNSSIPVITINLNSTKKTFRKIVFPFNNNLLSLKKLDFVIAISKLYNSKVLLLGYSDSQLSSSILQLRKKADEVERKLLEQNIECSFSFTMNPGYAQQILAFATEQNADLITVITSRNAHDDKILKQHPDKELVNHASIPVLSVPVE